MSTEDQDDLFRPSVQAEPVAGEPFHTGSLVWPAVFGGPLALLPFARRSARELGLPGRDVQRLTLTCVAGLLLAAVLAVVATRAGAPSRVPRLLLQGSGLLAYAAIASPWLLKGPQRRHELRGGSFASIGFWRGLAACVALGVVQGLLLAGLLRLAA